MVYRACCRRCGWWLGTCTCGHNDTTTIDKTKSQLSKPHRVYSGTREIRCNICREPPVPATSWMQVAVPASGFDSASNTFRMSMLRHTFVRGICWLDMSLAQGAIRQEFIAKEAVHTHNSPNGKPFKEAGDRGCSSEAWWSEQRVWMVTVNWTREMIKGRSTAHQSAVLWTLIVTSCTAQLAALAAVSAASAYRWTFTP
jgi:hypothetical protein